MNKGLILLLLLVVHGCATFAPDRKQSMSHYNLGVSYLKKGDTASAIKELREAERLYNKDPKIVHTLGMAYFKKGEVDLAVQQFKKALELGPDNDIVMEEFNILFESIKGQNIISEKLRNEILKKMLAEGIEAYKDGNYPYAMEEFTEILMIDAKNIEAQRWRKETTEKIDKSMAPLLKEGVKAYKNGDIDAAIISFIKVTNLEPGNKEAKEYLGKIGTGKIEATIKKEVDTHYLRGITHYTDGKYEEAIESWRKVLELEPRHEKAALNIDKAKRKIEGVTKTK